MKVLVLLGGLALTGCAASVAMPPIRGEMIAPGMYSFDAQREAVAKDSALATWQPNVFYPDVPELEVVPRGVRPRQLPERLPTHPTSGGPAQATAWLFYRGYQETWSRADGSTCRFRPTCSRFGVEAVREHGPLGLAMAFGRLHRNHSAEAFYPSTISPFLDDPVSNYDFSFRAPRLDDFDSYDDEGQAWVQHLRAVKRIDW